MRHRPGPDGSRPSHPKRLRQRFEPELAVERELVWDVQRLPKEDSRPVLKPPGALAVVVLAVEEDQFLRAAVLLVDCGCVMRRHKGVVAPRRDQGAHVAQVRRGGWLEPENVHTCPLEHGVLNHSDHGAGHPRRSRDPGLGAETLDNFLDELLQVREGRVEDHAVDEGVSRAVQERGGGPHRAPPKRHAGGPALGANILQDGREVVLLPPAQRDPAAVGAARAGKVDGQQ
mmetsp:Transcript_26401/g.99285  ORF Transcript_26401/g.99285 Transcript_26401/m.99285 type:complete len:230 (+) Transcript_26401:837-1526(+)